MSIITQGARAGDFLLSEANGQRSREEIVISAGSGKLEAGTLIAMITAANALTPTANGGNTGNGTIGSVTVTSEAVSGSYTLTITAAAANAGTFELRDPAGNLLGEGTVGQPFTAAGLTFTLADGSTDFIVGDGFTLAVLANLGEYTAYDDSGTDDGRRTAGGVLYRNVDATAEDVRAAAIMRDAEVAEALLIGLDANGRTDLHAVGIIVR